MPEPVTKTQARQTATVYLVVKGASRAIEFYEKAFGATELYRLTEPGGKVGHAELRIGNTTFMLADEYPDFGALSPTSIGGSPAKMHLYVDDADAAVKRAVDAGATLLRPVTNEFYGDRGGMVADPFGFSWFLAQHVEDVSPGEMQRRFEVALKEGTL
jgi:PhnB protein